MKNAKVFHGGGAGKGKGFSGAGGNDAFTVKQSSLDTIPNFLDHKIKSGNDKIIVTVENAGANEQMVLTAQEQTGDHKVQISGHDSSPDYLFNKIYAGFGIEKATVQPGGGGAADQLEISVPKLGKVNVDQSDLIPEFLINKILPSTGIAVGRSQMSPELPAALSIRSLGLAAVSAADTTPDFLLAKIQAGANITLSKSAAGANEKITISAGSPTAPVEHTLTYGTGTALSVGAFVPPVTEGSAWANSNLGQYIMHNSTIKEVAIMLPRFVSYAAGDSITFQFRRVAASSARGASPLSVSSGVALGTLSISCPNTAGAFWYNNYSATIASWALSAGDILFVVISAMTVNAVTGASLYIVTSE